MNLSFTNFTSQASQFPSPCDWLGCQWLLVNKVQFNSPSSTGVNLTCTWNWQFQDRTTLDCIECIQPMVGSYIISWWLHPRSSESLLKGILGLGILAYEQKTMKTNHKTNIGNVWHFGLKPLLSPQYPTKVVYMCTLNTNDLDQLKVPNNWQVCKQSEQL